MTEILQKIKDAKTMSEMDDLRYDVITECTNESLQAWQMKYKGLKCFRKPADIGYIFDKDKYLSTCQSKKTKSE